MNTLYGTDEGALADEGIGRNTWGETSEMERLEAAADRLGEVERLRPDAWASSSQTEREWCLRDVGQKLSDVYETPAPQFIGSEMDPVEKGILLGAYSDGEFLTRINRDLLQEHDPQRALETYCHEFRHAYQQEMADRYNSSFRHLCHDEVAAAEWAANLEEGNYVSFEEDPERYRAQSVETDARDIAARIMERMAKG